MRTSSRLFFTAFLLFLFSGCATITTFDQFAYVQVTSVKVEVLALIDKSVEPYSDHVKDIEEVNSLLSKAIEYEKHRPKNGITTRMWDKMFKIDSTGNLDARSMIPSYWSKWKKDGKERLVFVNEAKIQMGEGFDLIAELESKKIKPADSKVSTFLSNP